MILGKSAAVADGNEPPYCVATALSLLQLEFFQLLRCDPVPMARSCCVVGCNVRSQDRRGKKINNGLSFYCFPAWKQNQGSYISELTKTRRMAWISAVNRVGLTFDNISRSLKVCSRHFHSGKYINLAQEMGISLNVFCIRDNCPWACFCKPPIGIVRVSS